MFLKHFPKTEIIMCIVNKHGGDELFCQSIGLTAFELVVGFNTFTHTINRQQTTLRQKYGRTICLIIE